MRFNWNARKKTPNHHWIARCLLDFLEIFRPNQVADSDGPDRCLVETSFRNRNRQLEQLRNRNRQLEQLRNRNQQLEQHRNRSHRHPSFQVVPQCLAGDRLHRSNAHELERQPMTTLDGKQFC